jgi:hypothetical protein
MKIFVLLQCLSLAKHIEIWLLMVSPFGVKWTIIAPSISQNTVDIILLADSWLLNFWAMVGDVKHFQALLWALLSGLLWCT